MWVGLFGDLWECGLVIRFASFTRDLVKWYSLKQVGDLEVDIKYDYGSH